jgi:hypothetical protein
MNFTPITLGIFIVFVAFVVTVLIITIIRNQKIRKNGIEAEAVISRIEEYESTDSDGFTDTNYRYYVTYRTRDGKTVEARLGKIVQVRYHEGDTLNVMYLPDKPEYVVPVK